MHAHHYLGEANTDTLLYKLWQKLHDTPERAAQPDSHTQQPNAKPLAQKLTNLLVQLSIFLIDLFVGTYRLSSLARLEAFVIQTKLN